MTNLKDQLSWDEFYKGSINRKKPIKNISEFNRLIMHTKNFFVISGYGAFTKGYVLIISKEFIPSFGLIKKEYLGELYFLISQIKNINKKIYNRKSVIFEHGMCACVGGLDRAHVHIMTVNNNTNKNSLKRSINKVLYNRKVGIEYIKYGKYKLENIHDINQIFESIKKDKNSKKNNEFKIVGKILKSSNLQNLNIDLWPNITFRHINKGGHYVYFKSDYKESSFLTTHNFQTQFGREVVFYNEKFLDKLFDMNLNKLRKNNYPQDIWKWQNFMFEKNIIETIKNFKKGFKEANKEFLDEFKNYQAEII